MSSLLQFNPNKRISLDDLIANPIFDEIRQVSSEKVSSKKIELPVDFLPLNSNGSYDDYTINKMKEYIFKISEKFT